MKQKSTLRQLLRYAGRQKGSLFLVFVCAVLAGGAEIAAPFVIGRAIDHIKGPGQVAFGAVFRLLIVLLALYLIQAVFSYFVGRVSYRCAHSIAGDIRLDAYKKLMRAPLSYYHKTAQGDLVSRFVNDATAIADGLLEGITQLFSGLITIVGALSVMLYLSPIVTLAVLLITSITFIVANFITRISNKYFKQQRLETGALGGIVEESLHAFETLKAFGYEAQTQAKFHAVNDRLKTAGQKAVFISAITNPSTRLVNYLAYIAVGIVGGTAGGLGAGAISSFIIYSNQFARPFNQITAIITQILDALAAAKRVFSVIGQPQEAADVERPKRLHRPQGSVRFEHVYFSYSPHKPLIEDFSLDVKAGQRVAIVGPTGAGKTTLVNLLMRFYEVDAGAILIDGQDIRTIERQSLRENIGMVLQESWLFSGTVRENIAYGTPDAGPEDIVAAAKATRSHDFIKKLPLGYDTRLTDSGALSEGQRQLLAITRAMLGKQRIMILDEATSRVDTLTEHRIQQAFQQLMQGATCFVIAHRLSTIQDADLIIVMRDGHIVEQGTHEDLLAAQGFYSHLYHSQFAGSMEAGDAKE